MDVIILGPDRDMNPERRVVPACCERRGLCLADVGAWYGGHEDWNVTHVASGLAVVKGGPRRAAERALQRALALPIDWTQPSVVLTADENLCRWSRAIQDQFFSAPTTADVRKAARDPKLRKLLIAIAGDRARRRR